MGIYPTTLSMLCLGRNRQIMINPWMPFFSPNNRSLRFIIGIVGILWSSTYSTHTYIYCGDVLYANDCTIGLVHILWGFSDFAFLSCFLNRVFVVSFNRARQLQRAYLHKIHHCEYTIVRSKIHESHP
jgi:hypothetical protein